jgi:hypothetical protein
MPMGCHYLRLLHSSMSTRTAVHAHAHWRVCQNPLLPPPPQMSDKERKKINEKTRKQQETAARAKAEALRDDDNVFDVSFEQQGAGGEAADSVVSATDIKVTCLQLAPPMACAHNVWLP